jgi:hypothetical protein
LDVSELGRLGWCAKIPLREAIAAAYADFLGPYRTPTEAAGEEEVSVCA